MPISENIRYRAIGLLASYRDYCEQEGIPATQTIRESENGCGNHRVSGGNAMSVAGKALFGDRVSPDGLAESELEPRYEPGTGDDLRVDMDNLLRWLNSRFSGNEVSQTTAKCYRRWLASYFDALEHPESAVVRNWIPPFSPEADLVADIKDAAYLAAKAFDPKVHLSPGEDTLPGNSRYLSFVDRESFSLLLGQLLSETRDGKPRYQSGPQTALMFTVTMMTGLRPHEWPTARYLETFFDPETKLTLGPVLEVRTLKQTNRREDNPLREKRYLVLDRWPEEQIVRLKALLAEIESVGEDFDAYYNRARMTLSRAWKREQREARKRMSKGLNEADNALAAGQDDATETALASLSQVSGIGGMVMINDTRSVSFYTARHIFAEEIRRSVALTRFELAAMLGHSLLTNQVYYGPRQEKCEREYDFELPRPWPGDADEIRLWDYKVNPLRTAYMQGDLFGGMPTEGNTLGNDRPDDGVAGFYLR